MGFAASRCAGLCACRGRDPCEFIGDRAPRIEQRPVVGHDRRRAVFDRQLDQILWIAYMKNQRLDHVLAIIAERILNSREHGLYSKIATHTHPVRDGRLVGKLRALSSLQEPCVVAEARASAGDLEIFVEYRPTGLSRQGRRNFLLLVRGRRADFEKADNKSRDFRGTQVILNDGWEHAKCCGAQGEHGTVPHIFFRISPWRT